MRETSKSVQQCKHGSVDAAERAISTHTPFMPRTDLVQGRHDLQQQLGTQSSGLELQEMCKQGSTTAASQLSKGLTCRGGGPAGSLLALGLPLSLGGLTLLPLMLLLRAVLGRLAAPAPTEQAPLHVPGWQWGALPLLCACHPVSVVLQLQAPAPCKVTAPYSASIVLMCAS